MQIGSSALRASLHYASAVFKQQYASVPVILPRGIHLREIIRNGVKSLWPQETEIYVPSFTLRLYLWKQEERKHIQCPAIGGGINKPWSSHHME